MGMDNPISNNRRTGNNCCTYYVRTDHHRCSSKLWNSN